MSKSAERGKVVYGMDSVMDRKYRHTFYLVSGEELVGFSQSEDIAHVTFGRETAFLAKNDEVQYTIPFFSVGYIETEEIG